MISRENQADIDNGFVILSVINEETGDSIAKLPEQKIISIPDVGEKIGLKEVSIDLDEDTVDEGDEDIYIVEERAHSYTLADIVSDSDSAPSDILYTNVELSVTPAEEE